MGVYPALPGEQQLIGGLTLIEGGRLIMRCVDQGDILMFGKRKTSVPIIAVFQLRGKMFRQVILNSN